MRNVERLLIALLAAGLGTAIAAGPDLSGEWKLNVTKSDFGMAPPISGRTDKIVHKEPSLRITRAQETAAGAGTSEYSCTTDGKDCDISISGAAIKVSGAFKWVDNALTFDGKGVYNGGDLIIHEKWSLSPDHATITIQRHLSVSEGDTDQTLLLEKQ
ncbi:MAG: hypothetical protein LAP39_16095 [Acidobacteriia bacterium]|nr:hypothetical protein [Terriglobia bacterium]